MFPHQRICALRNRPHEIGTPFHFWTRKKRPAILVASPFRIKKKGRLTGLNSRPMLYESDLNAAENVGKGLKTRGLRCLRRSRRFAVYSVFTVSLQGVTGSMGVRLFKINASSVNGFESPHRRFNGGTGWVGDHAGFFASIIASRIGQNGFHGNSSLPL